MGGLFGEKDEELVFFIDVTEDQPKLNVRISGGSGDADLYVKGGLEPAKNDWDCRPYASGNTESCSGIYSGRVYVKLIGFSTFADVTIIAETSELVGGDFPKTDLSAGTGEWLFYEYTVGQGVSDVNVAMFGGSGDADLYVKKNQQPTKSSYDCRPFAGGNTENCRVSVSEGDVVHIGVHGYQAFSSVTLDVETF
ncbi:PPC domain-containing protein [Veronia nyctiphanis]|uniref:PPC domain-containing protein n=1 Tax=Veronia nyctiphanis TaxID=1278244 RepID=UPI0038B5B6D0